MAQPQARATGQQRQMLNQNLAEVRGRLENIISFVQACFGEESNALIRAEEARNALQRLEWALEREQQPLSKAQRV
jgi:uncharacterized coiled-coil DUF342 family protein